MKILVACEESQRVTFELRKRGHEAYSCDILSPSGGGIQWHIKQDCTPLLNGNCTFKTMDNQEHTISGKWDMIIAFPPCTHLAVSGARHFEEKRQDGRQREGIEFFCKFLQCDCDKVMIENPVGVISGDYIPKHFPDLAEKYGLPIKPTQIIQPYQFGDMASKKTCLWLKGLSPLIPVTKEKPNFKYHEWLDKNGKKRRCEEWYYKTFLMPKDKRGYIRSKTFQGIAKAIAEQWTDDLTKGK